MAARDGVGCPGCGLPNYEGMCPVCRGDDLAYMDELAPHFGEWENAGRYLPRMPYPTLRRDFEASS